MLRKRQSIIPLTGLLLALALAGGSVYAAEGSEGENLDVARAGAVYGKALRGIERDREAFKRREEKFCADLGWKIASADDSFWERLTEGLRRAEVRWLSPDPRKEAEVADATANVIMPGGTARVSMVCAIGNDEIDRVFSARENLENVIHQRALAAIARRNASGGAERPVPRWRVWVMRAGSAGGDDAIFGNSRVALRDLQRAVEDKIKANRAILEKRAVILLEASKPDVTSESRVKYEKELQELKKDVRVAEDKFDLRYGYIDAKLALEQFLARELIRIDARREALERARAGLAEDSPGESGPESGKPGAAGLSFDAARIARDAEEGHGPVIAGMTGADYAAEIGALETLKGLMIRAVQDRLIYLGEMNRVRLARAEHPEDPDAGLLTRGEVEGIENRRDSRLNTLRFHMLNMYAVSPVFFPANATDDAAAVRDRVSRRLAAAGRNLAAHFERESDALRNRLGAVDRRLSNPDVTGAARSLLERERAGLAKLYDALDSERESMAELLESYNAALEQAFSDADWRTAVPVDIAKLEQRYAEKIFDLSMRELRIEENSHPLAQLLSLDRDDIQAVNPYPVSGAASPSGSSR